MHKNTHSHIPKRYQPERKLPQEKTHIPWWWSRFIIAAIFANAILLLVLLSPILMPFVLGAGLAYLGDPIVDQLEKWKCSRTVGVVIVFLVFFILSLLSLLVFIPILQKQAVSLIQHMPDILNWLQNIILPNLNINIPKDFHLDIQTFKTLISKYWSNIGGIATNMIAPLSRTSMGIVHLITNTLLVPVVTFYLLRDWDILVAKIKALLPKKHTPRITDLASEVDEVLSAFVRGQLLVMLFFSVYYCLVLSLMGLDLALVIGILTGILVFVPYLGFIVGFALALLACFLQFGNDLEMCSWLIFIYISGHLFESMIITPWLVGDRIGLHPVTVIFAIMAGGQLFGFIGVLIALPVAAILLVAVRHIREWYVVD